MPRGGWWTLAVLVLLATISGLWPEQTERQARVTDIGHEPDYRMTRFELTAMSPAGTPLYHLTATNMRHFADDDSAEFDAPFLRYTPDTAHRDDAREWTFSAEQGWSATRGSEIRLLGAVRIDAGATAKQAPVAIETRDLRVFPEQRQATTTSAIRVSQAKAHIEGVGLDADLQSGKIQLLSKVRGHYAP